MEALEFKFSEDNFNRLFPFYILIDTTLKIKSFGKSIAKICPEIQNSFSFVDCFEVSRPRFENPTFNELVLNSNQLTVVKCKKSELSLRGQFELVGDSLLFVGSPWFNSMNEVVEKKLTLHDFALHDPLLDLLHVLNNQENISNELKELLTTINNQKNKLKKDKEELNRLSLVASSNENGIVFTEPDGKIFWCNESYIKHSGYSKEEILGKTPIEIGFIEETDRGELKKMTSSFFKGQPFDVELKHGRKDGSNFWAKTKGQPILNPDGQVLQFFAMIEDISLKKRYDESLQIEKEKYRSIIANMNLGLLEVDKNDVITLANQSFTEISGYTSDELIGKKAADLLLTNDSRETVKSKEVLREEGKTDSYEVKVIDKSGKNRNWLISGAPNYDINGKVVGSIGIHLDITEQKEQEEQLYLLSLIAEKNINAVIISDADGKIEWANKSFLDMSGYQMEEILGKKPGHLLQGKETNPDTVNYMKDAIAKGLPFNCEVVNYSKHGKKYWVSIQGQALYNKNGEIVKYFAIEENVTKKKELEQQREFLVESLAKSNKELEDYAAIVSHDLKSPLRSIHSLISWIKEDNDKELNEQTTQYLSMIEGKVEKMDHLIEGILTYAKIDKVDVVCEKVNTQEIIQNIINIIHIPSHISVTITNVLPIIDADRFRVQQLFQNIISNAVNYIDKPIGIVEVSCSEDSKHFIFSIKDNGPGIAKENQEKIFKIFQSLEKSEKSTGLGLSIVKKIVDNYNGKIWIESENGKGTTFFIQLNK
ncbi:PAS domain S-box protein [Flavobacterium sp.]|uniref:PAS domain S-box protein n=1 Tax=Flavobacterium sp. TaxID=239 RepID=UPI00260A7567|nr:PAS domain S-box protein [Flavobacterium sp.]